MGNIDKNAIVSMISSLCSKSGLSIKKMLEECGLSGSVVDNLKRGSLPTIDKIYKIANFFDVSVDYLLSGRDKNPAVLMPGEQEMVNAYRTLSDDGKAYIVQQLDIAGKVFKN